MTSSKVSANRNRVRFFCLMLGKEGEGTFHDHHDDDDVVVVVVSGVVSESVCVCVPSTESE